MVEQYKKQGGTVLGELSVYSAQLTVTWHWNWNPCKRFLMVICAWFKDVTLHYFKHVLQGASLNVVRILVHANITLTVVECTPRQRQILFLLIHLLNSFLPQKKVRFLLLLLDKMGQNEEPRKLPSARKKFAGMTRRLKKVEVKKATAAWTAKKKYHKAKLNRKQKNPRKTTLRSCQ